MFPYTINYPESAYDIQNINLLYNIDQKCQNTFEMLEMIGKSENIKNFKILYYYIYKFQHSYFVVFGSFVVFAFLYILYLIYYT